MFNPFFKAPKCAFTLFSILVLVSNGNRIEYELLGSMSVALVSVGDMVAPDTEIGRLFELESQPDVFTLKLSAFKSGTDEPLNPDCVEL